jgi:hypothetical protein
MVKLGTPQWGAPGKTAPWGPIAGSPKASYSTDILFLTSLTPRTSPASLLARFS